jgi:hypothetical protein
MTRKAKNRKNRLNSRLGLPDLEHSKVAVIVRRTGADAVVGEGLRVLRNLIDPESKPLPEGSSFRPIATQFHTAPATTMIFAVVVEPKDAFGIFTLAEGWVVRRSEEVGSIVRYGDQKIPRLFLDPTRFRLQSPLGMHNVSR